MGFGVWRENRVSGLFRPAVHVYRYFALLVLLRHFKVHVPIRDHKRLYAEYVSERPDMIHAAFSPPPTHAVTPEP